VALTNAYVQTVGQLMDLFKQIRQGQAPEQFTAQHLKDLGFRSSNHRLFLPLLKALGFLTADGKPTSRYHEYRSDEQTARHTMGQALKDAYGDLFVLREAPSNSDRNLFEGKFKSTHNTTDRMAKLMANTFFALLPMADINAVRNNHIDDNKEPLPLPPPSTPHVEEKDKPDESGPMGKPRKISPNLHYNIQIHLPATKDIEVYNAIFRSLKEHLLE